MLLRFKQQVVRDLAWVIQSPPSIDGKNILNQAFFEVEYNAFESFLIELDKEPQPLLDYIASQKRKNLGSYFEALIFFWLENRENTEILATNLQVVGSNRTLGEYDAIINIDDELTHLEVAVKFYLALENKTEQEYWVGTQKKDRLDIKLNKMLNRQMNLSDTVEGKAVLDGLNIDSGNIEKIALIKGYFFNYYNQAKHVWPKNSYKECNKGYWCRISELDDFISSYADNAESFCIHQKPNWLGELDTDKQQAFDKFRTDATKLIRAGRPALCSAIIQSENIRFFILDNSW